MIKIDVMLQGGKEIVVTGSASGDLWGVLNELALGTARTFVNVWQEIQGEMKDDISEMLLDILLNSIRSRAYEMMNAKEGETHDGD